jgi:hypothetical protein
MKYRIVIFLACILFANGRALAEDEFVFGYTYKLKGRGNTLMFSCPINYVDDPAAFAKKLGYRKGVSCIPPNEVYAFMKWSGSDRDTVMYVPMSVAKKNMYDPEFTISNVPPSKR